MRPRSRRTAARWAWLAPLLVVALAGCSFDIHLNQRPGTGADPPPCQVGDGQVDGGLVLAAQSVPTAEVLPCLRRLPEGLSVGGFSARKGRTRMWFVVGKEDRTALSVTLQRTCDLAGFAEAQSEVPGALRFDRQDSSGALLRGERVYRYSASCLRYEYSLLDVSALSIVRNAVGTIERSVVADKVAEDSRGHLRLDPDPGRSS
jgi:hypothetical protein